MRLNLWRSRLRESSSGCALLLVLSWLYEAAVRLRSLAYAVGLLPVRRLPVRTVCIGNLTAGGTGKTTAVLCAVDACRARQMKVAVLSRGYGRRRRSNEVVVLLDTNAVSWEDTGDEPWMMHRMLEGLDVPVLISSDRLKAGRTAVKFYAPQLLLLDDGFQHLRLRRDADIVLVSALDPFGGGALLPRGDLREPLSGLKRASLALLTHADRVPEEQLAEIEKTLRRAHPRLRIARAAHRSDYLLDLRRNERHRPAHLKGKRVACFSALGDPRPFEDELRSLGAHLEQVWRFPDHHPFTADELRSIENVRGGIPVITTLKDFPRLPVQWRELLSGEVLALTVRMEILSGKEDWEHALFDARRSS
ncbi:MAG: tetraacyldisaccharide 4'-kinase [Elusimicrobiota bacterium]|jgi:tetraacyldisaccharide 4'-kinase